MKFALLYLSDLKSIVPLSGDEQLSDLTIKIIEESDLLTLYRPSMDDRYFASDIAFDIIRNILETPERYRHIFHKVNLPRYITSRQEYDFLIYDEKISYVFKKYCLEKGLANEGEKGIMVNPIIGNLYMSLLANVIAEKNEFQCITDVARMDKYNILTRGNNNRLNDKYINKHLKVAKSVITSYIPRELSRIDINTIIQFRNSRDYSQALNSFHNEIDRYLTRLENGDDYYGFEEQMNESVRRLRRELMILTSNLSVIGFNVWSALNNNLSTEQIVAIAGGATSAIYTVGNIQEVYVSGEDARFTRKYLASLHNSFRDHRWGFNHNVSV